MRYTLRSGSATVPKNTFNQLIHNFHAFSSFLQQRPASERVQPNGTNDGLTDTRQPYDPTLCLHQNYDASARKESNKYQSSAAEQSERINSHASASNHVPSAKKDSDARYASYHLS